MSDLVDVPGVQPEKDADPDERQGHDVTHDDQRAAAGVGIDVALVDVVHHIGRRRVDRGGKIRHVGGEQSGQHQAKHTDRQKLLNVSGRICSKSMLAPMALIWGLKNTSAITVTRRS